MRESRELVACVRMYIMALPVFFRGGGVYTQARELDAVKGGLIALLNAVSYGNFS